MHYRAINTSLHKYRETGNNHEDRLQKIRDSSFVLKTRDTPFANCVEKSATGLPILQEVFPCFPSKHYPFVVFVFDTVARLTAVCVFSCGSHSSWLFQIQQTTTDRQYSVVLIVVKQYSQYLIVSQQQQSQYVVSQYHTRGLVVVLFISIATKQSSDASKLAQHQIYSRKYSGFLTSIVLLSISYTRYQQVIPVPLAYSFRALRSCFFLRVIVSSDLFFYPVTRPVFGEVTPSTTVVLCKSCIRSIHHINQCGSPGHLRGLGSLEVIAPLEDVHRVARAGYRVVRAAIKILLLLLFIVVVIRQYCHGSTSAHRQRQYCCIYKVVLIARAFFDDFA